MKGNLGMDNKNASKTLGKHRSILIEFWKNFKKNNLSVIGGILVSIFILLAVLAPIISPANPVEQFHASGRNRHPLPPLSESEEGHLYLFGSDRYGRDILSRSLYGIRSMLILALSATSLSLIIGIFFGSLSGFYRGSWIDEFIMRISDILLSFPALILALAFMGAFGVGDSEILGVHISHTVKLLIVISLTYAPIFARVMRSVVLQEVNEDYVAAAKVLGAKDSRIIIREILINTIPPMIVQATLMMAETVLISASLSFLGLGIQPPNPSLGVMLNEARDFMFQRSWWYAVVPGLFVSFSILGFNLLGDGLRDALDPHQSRKVKK